MDATKKNQILLGIIIIILLAISIGIFLMEKRVIQIDNKIDDLKILNELQAPIELPQKAIEITPEMWELIDCESEWDDDVVGDLDYIYPAKGLIQVQQRTWDWLSEKLDFQGDINNPQDQVRFLKLALENGYAKLWSCAKILGIN